MNRGIFIAAVVLASSQAFAGSGNGTSVPTGAMMPFAGPTAPIGYLLCDGTAVDRVAQSALFAVIGTAYGKGDGSTTFNLPDLRGRAVFGRDDMGGTPAGVVTTAGSGIDGKTLGTVGGNEYHVLTLNELPSHQHSITDP